MKLVDSLRRSLSSRSQAPAAHMTWGSRSVSQTFSSTRLFLKRQLWVWPIIAVVVLAALGWGVHRSIEATMKEELESELQTLLSVESAMLERWMATQEHNVEAMANNGATRSLVEQLVADADDSPTAIASDDPTAALTPAKLNKALAVALSPAMTSHGYIGFTVVDRNKIVIAASETETIGMPIPAAHVAEITKALDGETNILAPSPSVAAIKVGEGVERTGVPTMFAMAPVRDQNLQVVAVLGLRIDPRRDFTRILQMGRTGKSGETYAFDRQGQMLSDSRFDDDLIRLGVLPDQEGAQSMLNVLVRDPGGNLDEGYRPSTRRSAMPLTRMAQAATTTGGGVDVEGYNDYRGVPVVGAWTWLDKYDFGLATEVDRAEAFRPLAILQNTFLLLLGLLILSSIAIFVFTIMVARLQRQARAAAIEAKQLGQYKLDEKLGAGAMGVVYKGHHAMLRRPTAIKLLDADAVTEQSVARFEREVQITSQLNNPNTVAIYDFGRTPEGVFYYAMEYLEGIDLQTLVDQYGPQPPSRVIHLLRQVCGSLYEAHSMGLVHRDVKPANLMLTRRGGEADVVKVLDFGLVKARDDERQANVDRSLAGTPLYMSPEAIQLPSSVDACSDLYAVGAVGYFLLTGRPVFEASSIIELCNKHVAETPPPPSTRLGKPLPEDLENAILACLEKSRAKRPQTARDLAQRLARCSDALAWTLDDAEAWWARHERGQGQPKSPSAAEATLGRQYEATIDHQ